MGRIGTPNLNLGTFTDGEYPGAGSQSVDSDGLNGNVLKIDRAVGTEHNADGSHKANVIKGSNLVQTGGDSVVDGATVEFNANKIRVKDGGLTGVKVNQTPGQFVDGATIEFNTNAMRVKTGGVGTTQLADDAVTPAKISHDNKRTKILIPFDGFDGATGFAKLGATITSPAIGAPMLRAGSVTGLSIVKGDNAVAVGYAAYSTSNDLHFNAGEVITVYMDGTHQCSPFVGGTDCWSLLNVDPDVAISGTPKLAILEVEFDD